MAQDFTCTTLDMIRLKANQIWASNDKFMTSIRPQVEVAKRAITKQTAKTSGFDGGDCRSTKVWWYDACGSTPIDNDGNCDFVGDELKTSCKTYGFTNPDKMARLTIKDEEFCGNDAGFETAIAEGFLRMATDLDNQIEKFVIAGLDGFAGTNQYTADSRGNVVGTTTYVKPESWGTGLMSYFAKTAQFNQMPNACMFSGENMWDVTYNAQKNQLNSDEKDQIAKLDAFDWGFDLFNMDTLLGAKKTLMVSPDSYAFDSYNKFKNPTSDNNGANIERFNFASPNLPGVTYDVIYRTACANGGDDIVHHWKMIARYDLFQSPVTECAEGTGQTGIIAFECGTAP